VVNPWADQLTFLDDRTRTRRDHEKYLGLIDVIALLHQHRRPVKTATVQGNVVEYIEATLDDIAQANALAHQVLGRSLDELPPQTRRVLGAVCAHVRARAAAEAVPPSAVRFSRKDVRDASGWGDTQLKLHLGRLAELEYLLVHREGQSFAYELLYDGDGSEAVHLPGLIDVATLAKGTYDGQRSGAVPERSAPGRPEIGPRSAPGRSAILSAIPGIAPLTADIDDAEPEPRPLRANGNGASYHHPAARAGH